MKKIKNPFRVFVELRNVGSRVVMARVSSSLGFDRPDMAYLGEVVLCRLLPVEIHVFPLYDGSYALVRDDERELISCSSLFPALSRDLDSFTGSFELQDGKIHEVEVSLAQSADARCDYVVDGVRYVRLCGEVSIEVDVDELPEE